MCIMAFGVLVLVLMENCCFHRDRWIIATNTSDELKQTSTISRVMFLCCKV